VGDISAILEAKAAHTSGEFSLTHGERSGILSSIEIPDPHLSTGRRFLCCFQLHTHGACDSFSHCCDQIPGRNNLREVSDHHALKDVVEKNSSVGCLLSLVHSFS
jgi:hypothetical protein